MVCVCVYIYIFLMKQTSKTARMIGYSEEIVGKAGSGRNRAGDKSREIPLLQWEMHAGCKLVPRPLAVLESLQMHLGLFGANQQNWHQKKGEKITIVVKRQPEEEEEEEE